MFVSQGHSVKNLALHPADGLAPPPMSPRLCSEASVTPVLCAGGGEEVQVSSFAPHLPLTLKTPAKHVLGEEVVILSVRVWHVFYKIPQSQLAAELPGVRYMSAGLLYS